MGNSFENFVIQTERLYLRQVSLKDFSEVAAILQNPKVMYAYEHDFTDEDVYQWINRQIDRYCNYGFGLWAVILKEKGKLIGQAGLTMQHYKDKMVLEIGYLFNENYWNQGYTTEAAEACKKYAFQKLEQYKVYSIIKSDNFASMKVVERIGMKKEDEFVTQYYNGDMLHFLYGVRNDNMI